MDNIEIYRAFLQARVLAEALLSFYAAKVAGASHPLWGMDQVEKAYEEVSAALSVVRSGPAADTPSMTEV